MGPVLICDKSTLQALGPNELNALRRYYSLNIPHVLLVEILADLRKEGDHVKGQNEVRILANKLMPATSSVNADFRFLIRGELAGHKVAMDGRPVLAGGENVISPEGKRGVIYRQTDHAKALLRWQEGRFSEAENLMAESWRLSTQSIDLGAMQKHLKTAYSPRLNLKSLDDTVSFVDDLMCSASPKLLLDWFLRDIEMFGPKATEATREFCDLQPGTLTTRLPYTASCIRTALIFHFGLAFGLISTRSTNRVDLEYLYYLPFCSAFSSGDKFHHQTAPLMIRNQTYVPREEFKKDLNNLAAWWRDLDPSQRSVESELRGPPPNEMSATHKIWSINMRPGYRNPLNSEGKVTPEQSAKLFKEYQEALKKSTPTDKPFDESMEDCEFMMIEHQVRADGPCICGGEKLFKDCCGKKMIESIAQKKQEPDNR